MPASAEAGPALLVLNGGSSSLRCALFDVVPAGPRQRLAVHVERIGGADAMLTGTAAAHASAGGARRAIARATDAPDVRAACLAPDHAAALRTALEWMEQRGWDGSVAGVAHRFVHGGPGGLGTGAVTPELRGELETLAAFAPEHMPAQLALLAACTRRFPRAVQLACFDTAFHRGMPAVAQRLPLPRRLAAAGVRRYGFHGLSCAFLMGELERVGGEGEARGRVVLAHLGHGASLTAVRDGASLDTTMGFTPASGIPMGTRSGDIDPALPAWLARAEGLSAEGFAELADRRSGLLGVSETSGDMRELLAREAQDVRAAEAVALFCHHARKAVGALAAVLGGLDTLVFAGGIGERAPVVRERICAGLQFLGVRLDAGRNEAGAALLSHDGGRVRVRLIRTDEALQIARETAPLLTGERVP
ncbi:MAG TPA: acetate/propionate family kinase [Planctomycetota bacterium]|nr:acetate/propionate family kinase [Planctomycetota bacterium]